MLQDHLFEGIGFGRFKYEYLNYQYDYFKAGRYTIKELLLADNTKHAFNDYLEFWIENGLVWFILLIALLIFTALIINQLVKKYPENQTILFCSSQLIVLSIASLFTHVAEKPLYQIIFITSLITLCSTKWNRTPSDFICLFKILICTTLVVTATKYYNYLYNINAYRAWNSASPLFASGFLSEALIEYSNIYPHLKSDFRFLDDYSALLGSADCISAQESILRQLCNLDNASIFHWNLAKCLKKRKKIKEAEVEFIRAIYTVPNRLTPRYDLIQLYLETNQHDKVFKTCKELLTIPVKVSSTTTSRIRSGTRFILNKVQNNRPNLKQLNIS